MHAFGTALLMLDAIAAAALAVKVSNDTRMPLCVMLFALTVFAALC